MYFEIFSCIICHRCELYLVLVFTLDLNREWRFYNYEPKTVKFASDLRGSEGKDGDITINLPQFSSAAFLKVQG